MDKINSSEAEEALLEKTWCKLLYKSVCNNNWLLMDLLVAQQEEALQNMEHEFDESSNAYCLQDVANFIAHSSKGYKFQEKAHGFRSKKLELEKEIQNYKEKYKKAITKYETILYTKEDDH